MNYVSLDSPAFLGAAAAISLGQLVARFAEPFCNLVQEPFELARFFLALSHIPLALPTFLDSSFGPHYSPKDGSTAFRLLVVGYLLGTMVFELVRALRIMKADYSVWFHHLSLSTFLVGLLASGNFIGLAATGGLGEVVVMSSMVKLWVKRYRPTWSAWARRFAEIAMCCRLYLDSYWFHVWLPVYENETLTTYDHLVTNAVFVGWLLMATLDLYWTWVIIRPHLPGKRKQG